MIIGSTLTVGGDTRMIDDNTLTVSGSTLMIACMTWQRHHQHDTVAMSCHGQYRLDSAIVSMTRSRHH
jgi:hypothetical protein